MASALLVGASEHLLAAACDSAATDVNAGSGLRSEGPGQELGADANIAQTAVSQVTARTHDDPDSSPASGGWTPSPRRVHFFDRVGQRGMTPVAPEVGHGGRWLHSTQGSRTVHRCASLSTYLVYRIRRSGHGPPLKSWRRAAVSLGAGLASCSSDTTGDATPTNTEGAARSRSPWKNDTDKPSDHRQVEREEKGGDPAGARR